MKAQILTEQVSSSTIASKVPGYSEIITVNTVTISYTPPSPATEPTPIDGDTTTESNGVFDYATSLSSNITLSNGNYTTTSLGKVWTLRISIPNALNIGLLFTRFNLSPTAEMYIYNDAKTVLKNKIKKSDFTTSDTVMISPLRGNAVTVYIMEPNNIGTFQSNITIGSLYAGFEQIGDVGTTEGGTSMLLPNSLGAAMLSSSILWGSSLNCIPQIQCYPQFLVNARAVARISIPRASGAVGYCTGTLINNESNNGQAFLLTAFHCVDRNKNNVIEISEAQVFRQASFQFQFWQTDCYSTVNNRFIEFNGANLRASSRASDVALFELINPPGIGDGVNYAGWSRSTATPSNSLSKIIHHPRGENMRITQTRFVRTFLFNSNYWQAGYSSGTVAKGSSGSALLNETGQIVGQLKGGASSCNYTDFSDRYGKFDRSWTGAGLQIWLSRTQNLTSMSSLILSSVDIQGPSAITCNGGTGQFSVPNLLGATYEWVVSSNLQIISGLNTSTVTVSNVGTGNSGTITVTLRTPTKGRNRSLTVSKTIGTGAPIVNIAYTPQSCSNGYQTWFLQASSPNTISNWQWTVDNPSSGSWNIQTPNSASTYVSVKGGGGISITATNSCGTTKTGVTIYSNCPFAITATPNPAIDEVSVAVLESAAPSTLSKQKSTIRQIQVTDVSGNVRRQYKYAAGLTNLKVSLGGLNKGVYTIRAFDGITWSSTQVIKQ